VVVNILVHTESLQPLLYINSGALLFPRDRGFWAGVEVNPHEATAIHVYVDRKKRIILLVEICIFLEARRLRQITGQAIRPPYTVS
jgi:hypothetical protein